MTLRRLNRVEYRNTIRDLMGVDYDTTENFPADDSGYGFDNIGDVLSLSPLLMEKYLQAAEKIVDQAVPSEALVVAERRIDGERFRSEDGRRERRADELLQAGDGRPPFKRQEDRQVSTSSLDLELDGDFEFDPAAAA